MYATSYSRASSIDEAVEMFSKSENGAFIAGGQTLLPTMKQRRAAPDDLIDLRHIDALKGIAIDGNKITIGAATTHAEVTSDSALQKICPAISSLAGEIGDPAVRHMGTIGGSIANNDPAADYPAAMMALNAQIETNKRIIDTDDFFVGLFETALEEGELIIAIHFPAPGKAAYAKFANPASRYAMCGVFAAKLKNGMARIGITGAGNDGVFRHEEMEAILTKDWSASAIADCAVDESAMLADIHGSAAYRANLVKTMAKRAVEAAS